MYYPSYHTCDLCTDRYESRDGLRNDVQIENGEDSRSYIDVCDRCIKKLVKAIDEAFPRNIKNTSA